MKPSPHLAAVISLLLILPALTGCAGWRMEQFYNERQYVHDDPASLRTDLEQTTAYMRSIGLTEPETCEDNQPITETFFIRRINDPNHANVRLRGAARLDKPGWVMTIRVESYGWTAERAVHAGAALLNEIDQWHQSHISR
jgi:hypothetical protein